MNCVSRSFNKAILLNIEVFKLQKYNVYKHTIKKLQPQFLKTKSLLLVNYFTIYALEVIPIYFI